MADDIHQLPMLKCSRVIAAMHAGVINPGEMFRLLDELILPGEEQALIANMTDNTKQLLLDIYVDRRLNSKTYGTNYRTHLAFCAAGFVA